MFTLSIEDALARSRHFPLFRFLTLCFVPTTTVSQLLASPFSGPCSTMAPSAVEPASTTRYLLLYRFRSCHEPFGSRDSTASSVSRVDWELYQPMSLERNTEGLWFGTPSVTSSCKRRMSLMFGHPAVPQAALPVLDSASFPFETVKSVITFQRPSSLAMATVSDAAKPLKSYCKSSPMQAFTACSALPTEGCASPSSSSYAE